MLTGIGAFIAVIEVMGVSCRRKYEAKRVLLSVVFGLVGLVCIAIGFRHFVLWASGG